MIPPNGCSCCECNGKKCLTSHPGHWCGTYKIDRIVNRSVVVGIVGSEGSKFTKIGEERAKDAIRNIIIQHGPDPIVSSGHCHLGGIDIFAEHIAEELKLKTMIFPPAKLSWEGGYKKRNLQIAKASDIIYCITVDKLPPDYSGMKFDYCYHCAKAINGYKGPHIKSGGCWTVIQGVKNMGKEGRWVVINND